MIKGTLTQQKTLIESARALDFSRLTFLNEHRQCVARPGRRFLQRFRFKKAAAAAWGSRLASSKSKCSDVTEPSN